jgi:hypothetical protein
MFDFSKESFLTPSNKKESVNSSPFIKSLSETAYFISVLIFVIDIVFFMI